MSNYSVGYHDYIDESFPIIVDTDCLDKDLPAADRKWIIRVDDFSLFVSQVRARMLRDLLSAALDRTGSLTQDESESERQEHAEDNIRDSMPDVDDGGVSDIERENDAQTVCEDAEVEF